jgi:DNA invertase Pin-like site-specific DNA recombinase
MSDAIKKRVRCAVYTRKSTEEGLDQEYTNRQDCRFAQPEAAPQGGGTRKCRLSSIDAQKDAGHAYIVSQRAEGWIPVADDYDDPAYSGGTMERPALQRLLVDIAAGKIDVVVVYKLDRLSRSLTDFCKMVEVFERHGASFVSVTQQLMIAHPCALTLQAASLSKSSVLTICQHHLLHGTVDAEHPALIRPV